MVNNWVLVWKNKNKNKSGTRGLKGVLQIELVDHKVQVFLILPTLLLFAYFKTLITPAHASG